MSTTTITDLQHIHDLRPARTDHTKPGQTRLDQARPNQTIPGPVLHLYARSVWGQWPSLAPRLRTADLWSEEAGNCLCHTCVARADRYTEQQSQTHSWLQPLSKHFSLCSLLSIYSSLSFSLSLFLSFSLSGSLFICIYYIYVFVTKYYHFISCSIPYFRYFPIFTYLCTHCGFS